MAYNSRAYKARPDKVPVSMTFSRETVMELDAVAKHYGLSRSDVAERVLIAARALTRNEQDRRDDLTEIGVHSGVLCAPVGQDRVRLGSSPRHRRALPASRE